MIAADDGRLIGLLQAVNKQGGSTEPFGRNDEELMRMMASHISIFITNIE